MSKVGKWVSYPSTGINHHGKRQAAMKHPLLVFIPPIGGIIEGEDSLFDKVWVLTGELCDKILPPC